MNVWTGSIPLGSDSKLEGIRLVDPNSYSQSELSKESQLNLRSFVNPALIPLHARAGPNLELHTSHAGTSRWLQRKLTGALWLNEEDPALQQSFQCPVGLLVSVEGNTKSGNATTTSLLVYGVLSSAASCTRPPTPPHSSPSEIPDHRNRPHRAPYELRIYAVPLSTSRLTQAQAYPSPPPSNPDQPIANPRCAEFLPDISSPSPKRKRVATLFEVVAQHHRRVRQRGGEAVSQLMAPSRPLSSSQNLQTLRIKREPEEDGPTLPSLDRIVSHRSRSVSIGAGLHRPGSVRGRTTPALNADPQKRAPTPNPCLDSGPRRGEQMSQGQGPSSLSVSEEKPASTPGSPAKDPDAVIADNKTLITRTVLTCMRLYGFHRADMRSASGKPPGGAGAEPELDVSGTTPAPEALRAETPAPGITSDDDEFKVMYHATYKAAAFALRRYLKQAPGVAPSVLKKEKAMTCIDELLRLFCEEH
ncbi:hypothetical protein DTO013E5_7666 [Penicillium roqueforti]|uniref:Sld7 C-terminal domain-containing protein n=1 Tax=Penicillium roqueforti (strain FM164) TaxID=1365484 RepID=W6R6S4_PENRF|nr:hypothetical protein CBS147355_9278 [Penicillium roqueforti]CDM37537.1 unnamed protein product [Penicillium roqueforti FM164]KAI2673867.1 hypothetical protein LCP963914a_8941 [Penicillium roqueforti]KAI2708843.1 hypothetical protein CBS147318_9357 [Penicillium roqueforti]KAI2743227.1 hypothetical protein DTO012A1_3141 [Penicillium roqueforti]